MSPNTPNTTSSPMTKITETIHSKTFMFPSLAVGLHSV